MSIAGIKGQERVVKVLLGALAGSRLPHALLFHGPDGVGKKAAAVELAKALNCQSPGPDACDECIQCRKIARMVHPDVTLVERKGDKAKISVEQVREMVRTVHQFKPYEGKAKVLILNRAEEVSQEGENALLKSLEEPPSDTYIVLVTSKPNRLLPTTRSRCQTVAFSSLPFDLLLERALEMTGGVEEDAALLASLASGSLSRLKALEKLDLDEHWTPVKRALSGDLDPLAALDHAAKEGRSKDSAELCLELVESGARNLALAASSSGDRRLAVRILEIMDDVARKRRLLDRGANPRLLLENLFLDIIARP